MKIENLEKAKELASLREELIRKIDSLTQNRELGGITFDFGGPNVNVRISHPKLLATLNETAIRFLSTQKEQLEEQIGSL